MKEKELRRSLAVLPIGTVMKLTDLTARQIRYYEEQKLVIPERNEGNRRMYSLNDIDKLLEIKDYLAEGLNMADIKEMYKRKAKEEAERKEKLSKSLSDNDVRRILHDEFIAIGGFNRHSKSSIRNNKTL
ncbi:MerR family transcriptional regulator [Ligilactobacillus sp. LYQ135]